MYLDEPDDKIYETLADVLVEYLLDDENSQRRFVPVETLTRWILDGSASNQSKHVYNYLLQ